MSLKVNWLYLLPVGLLITATCALFITLSFGNNNLFESQNLRYLVRLTFGGVCFASWMKVYRDMKVEITENYISRPSLALKKVRMKWDQIASVDVFSGAGIHIKGDGKTKIVLSPYTYKNPQSLFEYIISRSEYYQNK